MHLIIVGGGNYATEAGIRVYIEFYVIHNS